MYSIDPKAKSYQTCQMQFTPIQQFSNKILTSYDRSNPTYYIFV